MFTRPGLRLQSAKRMNAWFGTPAEGKYTNIPFTVKTKFIPFKVYYWGILGTFFAFPFLTTAWQMYKAGNFSGN
ncbi:hypothetical protein DFJ63DRAFT_332738 [Scheffersomyces coipomensis]|uniref:uncharacterized protein n=1 Tax=Scheffersomyces coipomensis TaxID=1788519 RepID=UPI00315DD01F